MCSSLVCTTRKRTPVSPSLSLVTISQHCMLLSSATGVWRSSIGHLLGTTVLVSAKEFSAPTMSLMQTLSRLLTPSLVNPLISSVHSGPEYTTMK
ncbi:hypothetical protein RIF29_04376 [Crotalaria pallida]|uniref:Uncharacterized protein n=1 Tax=Crotalaria pallida TaxID=3830 RepID=A0AAN9J0Y6_CROPI